MGLPQQHMAPTARGGSEPQQSDCTPTCAHPILCRHPAATPRPWVHAVRVRAAGGNGSSEQYDYDVFTIGAGSGGVRGSRFAASYGGAWGISLVLV